MSIQRISDPERKFVFTTMRGVVTTKDMVRHFEAIRNEEGHDWTELIDARAVWRVGFNASELPSLAAAARQIFAGRPMAKRAMVVSDLFHFGLARIFASAASNWVDIQVFDSLDAADDWLTRSSPA